MKNAPTLFAVIITALIFSACSDKRSGNPRILVFSKTAGFRHSSIPQGKAAIMKLGQQHGFDVDTTENAAYFTPDSLEKYAAVVFLNTTGDILDNYQEAEFERYIQAGGNFVGIHSATDTEYDWAWYGRLVGAYFESHPQNQQAKLIVKNAEHISTKHLPAEWTRLDEWYNFKNLNPKVNVLLSLDESSYEGGKNGDNHPMAWFHEYDGGRAFYTGIGHTEASYEEENYLKHILGGIQYAVGDNINLDYKKASTQPVPEEDRFTKTTLTEGQFFEPTEMTILPNFDILVSQRRGEIMLYKSKDSTLKQAGFLNVYYKTSTPGVNAEEGLLGMQADPDFARNHFIYLFYSPVDSSVNRLSRFTFENDTIDLKSEKVILQLYSQREICCHTGGSIAFGPDRLLYVSTGDNSTPFDEPKQTFVNRGFAPLDDRPGHEQYDARRSSGNTNDLRGKILRIRIKEDGTYEIPEGNLFNPTEQKARPEIFVMGNRNPYRISVDKKTGFLYWGEVGPDASNDSTDTRGPRGYDEVNQAKKAGFFGWPLFVGNNYPYKEFDYSNGQSGQHFDYAKPVNNSRNNTGLQQLPPAQPAFIWYPYAASTDFPQVGTGGRNAMAGPVYYTEDYPKETRFPDYYNKKLFIYDWIRGWIKAVTMDENGDFEKMEPFMKSTRMNAPIDMEMGPDGRLYILEYGKGWFSKNPDAALSRIDFNGGNRAPKVDELTTDKTSGSLPLQVSARVEAKDPENKPMKYRWKIGKELAKETTEPSFTYTIEKAGDHILSVEVADEEGVVSSSNNINVYAGNEAPKVTIDITGNKTFYFPGKPVNYVVSVNDKEDKGPFNPANLIVSADYIEGTDKAASSQGHQVMSEAMAGKNLMLSLDCKTCHQVDQKSIGPSYVDVARRYEKTPDAVPYLVGKIIKGGGGVWGETAMSAHPDLPESDARQIVTWIRSLTGSDKAAKSLSASGAVQPTLNKPIKDNGTLYISATYTDSGGQKLKPLMGNYTKALRNSKVGVQSIRNLSGYTTMNYEGRRLLIAPKEQGWFAIDSIDLTGITGFEMAIGWQAAPVKPYLYEVRIDSPQGELVGNFSAGTGKSEKNSQLITGSIKPISDGKMHSLYFVSRAENPQEPNIIAIQSIQFLSR